MRAPGTPLLTMPHPAPAEPSAERRGAAPHPRDMLALVGHEGAEAALLAAYKAGRLPQGVILSGPEGIGKATLAYRLARFVLAHPDPVSRAVADAATLAVVAGHPAAQFLSARAHPDFVSLSRAFDPRSKRLKTQIGVEDVRSALELFGKTAGFGGWRICLIDAADDLNASSANALLKSLEEPPPRSLFVLIAHAPQHLLATIRSRCWMVRLAPLSEAEVLAITTGLPAPYAERPIEDHRTAARHAEGSPGRAIDLLDPETAKFRIAVAAAIAALPRRDPLAIEAIAQAVAGREGEKAFGQLVDAVEIWLSERIRTGAAPARLAPFAELWNKLAAGSREVEALGLDRRPFVTRLFIDLAEAARGESAA